MPAALLASGASATWASLALAGWAMYLAWPRRMTWVRSDITGKLYYVKNLPDKAEVADRLAALEVRLLEFLDKADAYAPGDPRLANIRARWNGTLAEILQDAEVAYSLGKGSVSLCVRNPVSGALEPENTSMFVLLHELAHVATDSWGHKPEFWGNMKLLMELAELTGSYTYEDFDASSANYCGRELTSSPLTCLKRKTCTSELRRAKRP